MRGAATPLNPLAEPAVNYGISLYSTLQLCAGQSVTGLKLYGRYDSVSMNDCDRSSASEVEGEVQPLFYATSTSSFAPLSRHRHPLLRLDGRHHSPRCPVSSNSPQRIVDSLAKARARTCCCPKTRVGSLAGANEPGPEPTVTMPSSPALAGE